MQVFYLYLIIIVLSPVVVKASQKRFKLEILNISCQSFTNHLKQYECIYTKVENGNYLLNTKFMADRKFGKDIAMHLRLSTTPWSGKKTIRILDFKTDICMITSQVVNNIWLRKLFDEWIRSSNYPLDCCYKANVLYKVENYTITDEIVPAYAPFMNISLDVEILENSKIICNFISSAALIPKK